MCVYQDLDKVYPSCIPELDVSKCGVSVVHSAKGFEYSFFYNSGN